jgi:sensor domain CHASE-containing protein
MSIAKKTILMVVLVTIALFSLVYTISNFIYLRGFEELENHQVERSVTQVAEVISVKMNALE